MECTEPVLIPNSSASTRTATRRSCMTEVRPWSMSSSFRLVEGLPERASLSTDVRPSSNRLYRSLICVMPMASSPKTQPAESPEWFPLSYRQASGKIWCNTAARVVPSFSQKITMRRAVRIHSHTLSARDWRCLLAGKKSTYAHEGTLHLSTTAHLPCFISFRGKKSRRILFEQATFVFWKLAADGRLFYDKCDVTGRR